MRDRVDLFIASVLTLFLELACIRWFPAHVLFLTFFTNVMLLASFLGISVGCLTANRPRNYLAWTPALLVIAIALAQATEGARRLTNSAIEVGNHVSPQLVFFGVESQPWDPSRFVIPIEAVSGAFFVLYAGLILALAASAVVPLDAFLGMSREWQIAGSCLLAFTPVLFAGVIFATSFSRAIDADRAFGGNVAGAMMGGLSEYSSMLLGFQYAVLVALGFYALSAWTARERK